MKAGKFVCKFKINFMQNLTMFFNANATKIQAKFDEIGRKFRLKIWQKMKIVLFLLLLFAIFVISLCVGSDGLNFSDLFAFSNDDLNGKIMREIRLPHTLAALICGAALALSGAAMQSIFKNALASPYTLGVSNAGAFGASFYIIFLQEIPFESQYPWITKLVLKLFLEIKSFTK